MTQAEGKPVNLLEHENGDFAISLKLRCAVARKPTTRQHQNDNEPCMLKRFLQSGHRLQTKLSVLVLGVSLLFAGVSVCMQLGVNYANTVRWTTQSLEKRIDAASDNLVHAIQHDDLSLMVRQLKSLAGMPHISNVHLTYEGNSHLWADNITLPRRAERIITQSLTSQGETLGTLEVYLDYTSVEMTALESAIPSALFFLTEAILVALLILLLLKKTFTRRISDLVDSVDRIDLNKVSKFAIPDELTNSKDEIGQVARSIQEMYMRIRADCVHNKLKERTLKQHKSLLAEEVSLRAKELEWQNRSNKLLAALSLRLIKGHKASVEFDVRLCMPELAKLFEADHIFWLSLDQEKVLYRVSYPENSDEPTIDISDMYLVKRWLMEAQEVALLDLNTANENAIIEPHFLKEMGIHSLAMFPLSDGRKSFGLLAVTRNNQSLQWNENKSLLLKRYATMLSELTIRERDHQAMTELQEELIMANERLRLEAETDELTRLLNRRPFSRQLSNALYQAVEEGDSLTVMMVDIDHFKAYNDIYGHLQGDKALKYVARAMANVARQFNAPLARFGGEEFALLLPKSNLALAQEVTWQLCQSVRDLCIPHQGSQNSGIVTISIGGVVCEPDGLSQPNQLLEFADQSLYKAKRGGRNRAELKQYNAAAEDVF